MNMTITPMTLHVFPLADVREAYAFGRDVELSDILQWLDNHTIDYHLSTIEFGELDNFSVMARTK
jgi:hypothetical protein